MSWKWWTRKTWNILISAEAAWAVSQWLKSLFWGSNRVLGMVEIHSPVYEFFIFLGLSMLVGINYDIIRMIRPKNRFHSLAGECREALDGLRRTLISSDNVRMTSETEILLRNISHKMTRLGISYFPQDAEGWFHWLPTLISWAETKDLASARKYSLSETP